jgi:hypothetical protein
MPRGGPLMIFDSNRFVMQRSHFQHPIQETRELQGDILRPLEEI